MKILKTFILVIFAKIANAQAPIEDLIVKVTKYTEGTGTDKTEKTLTKNGGDVKFKFSTDGKIDKVT